MNNDVTLYYDGGCGGVMFMLNFLLCTRATHMAGWQNGYTLDEIIDQTWQIPNEKHRWKDAEIATDGMRELVPAGKYALTRFCNYDSLQEELGPATILLYTDADTHVELARMKKPNWWYYNYYELRDPRILKLVSNEHTTPLNTFKDFEDLNDAQLKLDLVARAFLKIWPDALLELDNQIATFKKDKTVFVDNITINESKLAGQVEYAFRLQDVVRTRFRCVTKALGLEYNEAVIEHTEGWLALHPPHIRKLLRG